LEDLPVGWDHFLLSPGMEHRAWLVDPVGSSLLVFSTVLRLDPAVVLLQQVDVIWSNFPGTAGVD
jgi:hypothetical protein